MKKIFPYLIIAVVAIGFIGVIAYVSITQNNSPANSGESYFDDNATVLYFYSDNCASCLKQKPILAELALEGFRVKPVNVFDAKNSQLVADNKVESTPTFLSQKDGERMIGFHEKASLRDWLLNHSGAPSG